MEVTPEAVQSVAQKTIDAPQPLDRHSPAGEERGGLMASAPRSETPSAVPPLTPARPVIWPPRVHKTLSNGLEVVLVESHTIPKFTGELFFRSGNAVTAAKAPGLADMTATVARTGTTRRTSREIEEDLRRMGSDLSSGAGADTSVISFAGLVDFSNDLLGLVSELAQQASFPEDEFERERRQLRRGLAHRAHHARLSGQRTLAARAVWRASVRHDFADRRAGDGLPRRAAQGVLPALLPAGKCVAGDGGRFRAGQNAGAD